MTDGLFKVNIDGKEACLKFSMGQIERMNEINKEHEGSIIYAKSAMIFSALETYYRHAKIECPFTQEDVHLWADNLTTTDEGNKLLAEIEAAFAESVVFKKLIADAVAINDKKKLNGLMSEVLPLES